MNSWIHEGERLDDLQRGGYQILQHPGKFCFGMDAILLSDFARITPRECVLDLGTGTGILPILLKARNKGKHFTGLEIQEEMAEMAARSVGLNGLEDFITIQTGDIREADRIFGKASFDVIVSNPPYIPLGQGKINPQGTKAIARHEVFCTLEDMIRASARLLKTGGKLFLVHRPNRLAEIMGLLREYKMEPKRLRLVHPQREEEAHLILVEACRGAGVWMQVESPLILYDHPGVFSRELEEIYAFRKEE